MNLKLRIACAALLVATALPAMALQLGEIQVKSALNQPLVAAIPLHPKNLTELDGLTVGLASADDFQRAGLALTPTDQTLRFHVVTDNNGQKLILVTSSQPVTDPYLDFLVQVNTREGKQVREFVVLLNPVIAAPAPAVEAAPVASASAAGSAARPAELPAPSQFPQPTVKPQQAAPQPTQAQPQRHPAPAPSRNIQSGGQISVQRGDTLYGLAKQATEGTGASINQMMLALLAANPGAFFKDNINNLRAGAILRLPTRDEIDQRSLAAATAEVHRQYEAWRAAKPHPATVVEGAAAQAAANAAPRPGKAPPVSDHLTLVPPAGEAGGASNRPGVAGGTGTATVSGLRQQLQANRDSLVSLSQSNSDLESRVRSLDDISAKTGKLLSMKDATIAELQRKLAAVQAGAVAAASGTSVGKPVAKSIPAPATGAKVARKPAAQPARTSGMPWYTRPLTWLIAGLVVLALVALSVFGRRRASPGEGTRGPLSDPDDVSPRGGSAAEPETPAVVRDAGESTHPQPAEAATGPEEDPYGLTALRQPSDGATTEPMPPAAAAHDVSAPPATQELPHATAGEPAYIDDPVDTKLDLARAYLDMGDPVGARAMLEEVLEEGSQMQKDEAKRLLADAPG